MVVVTAHIIDVYYYDDDFEIVKVKCYQVNHKAAEHNIMVDFGEWWGGVGLIFPPSE